jgi:hypothetical protein
VGRLLDDSYRLPALRAALIALEAVTGSRRAAVIEDLSRAYAVVFAVAAAPAEEASGESARLRTDVRTGSEL